MSLSNSVGPHSCIFVLFILKNQHIAFLSKELNFECLLLEFYLPLLFSIPVMPRPVMVSPLNVLSLLYLQNCHQNFACYYAMAFQMTDGYLYRACQGFANFFLLIIFSLNFTYSIICCSKEFSLIVRISIVQV